jgi:hypothetical protein
MSRITSSGLGSVAARNLKFVLVPALLACTSLTGCGTIRQAITNNGNDQLVSASPLDVTKVKGYDTLDAADRPKKLEFLAGVVGQSQKNCDDFLNALVLSETSFDSTLDVAGTVFSALGTAFSPPGTKTALSAATSIVTGAKANIDSDIYAKAAIADFSTAIQGTYYAQMKLYRDKLDTLNTDSTKAFLVNNEIATIQNYHAECGLAPAEAAIRAKLGTPTQQTAAPGAAPNNQPHALGLNLNPGAATVAAPAIRPGEIPGAAW